MCQGLFTSCLSSSYDDSLLTTHLVSDPRPLPGLTAVQFSPLHLGQQRLHAEVGPQPLHVVVVAHVEARQQVNVCVHGLYLRHRVPVFPEIKYSVKIFDEKNSQKVVTPELAAGVVGGDFVLEHGHHRGLGGLQHPCNQGELEGGRNWL